jgi:hypothetical protein
MVPPLAAPWRARAALTRTAVIDSWSISPPIDPSIST